MRRRAFTIIELLVVVAIIAALIAILVPTLGAIYAKGYKTKTQALMNNLQTGLSTYYTHFSAFPGPADPMMTTVGVGGKKVSGAQNLLLGLAYWNGTFAVNLSLPGVKDSSIVKPDGSSEQMPPFFSPVVPNAVLGGKAGNIASLVTTSGAAAPANTYMTTLPVVIDAFPDALPVLYYRRPPGHNGAAGTDVSTNPDAAYYLNENIEYTSVSSIAAIDATRGKDTAASTVYNQTTGALAGGASSVQYLGKLVSTDGTPTGTPHGGYLMIDAGADRIYGTADDIVIVAGD